MSLILFGIGNSGKPVVDPVIFQRTVVQVLNAIEAALSESGRKGHQDYEKAKQEIVGEVTYDSIRAHFNGSTDVLSYFHQQRNGESFVTAMRENFEPILRKDKVAAKDIKMFMAERTAKAIAASIDEDRLLKMTDAFDVNVEEPAKRSMDEEKKIRLACLEIIKTVIDPEMNNFLMQVSVNRVRDANESEIVVSAARALNELYKTSLDKIRAENSPEERVVKFRERKVWGIS